MLVETSRMGTIDVDSDTVITLPNGLIGLPQKRRFVLMEFGEGMETALQRFSNQAARVSS